MGMMNIRTHSKEILLRINDLIVIFKDGLLDRILPIYKETRYCYYVNVAHSGGVSSAKISKRSVY